MTVLSIKNNNTTTKQKGKQKSLSDLWFEPGTSGTTVKCADLSLQGNWFWQVLSSFLTVAYYAWKHKQTKRIFAVHSFSAKSFLLIFEHAWIIILASSLGHEKFIFCFSGTAAFVFRPPLQNFYPKMVPICLSNRSCFRYRGIIFNSSAYLLQVWLN